MTIKLILQEHYITIIIFILFNIGNGQTNNTILYMISLTNQTRPKYTQKVLHAHDFPSRGLTKHQKPRASASLMSLSGVDLRAVAVKPVFCGLASGDQPKTCSPIDPEAELTGTNQSR